MKKITRLLIVFTAVVALSACSSKQQADVEVLPDGSETGSVYGTDGSGNTVKVERPNAAGGALSQSDLSAQGVDAIYFAFDSSALDGQAQGVLRSLAGMVRERGVNKLTIEGHCDERGTREYNLALGDRRAVAIKKYLVGLGVDARKITTISFGKERPVDAGHNESAWSKNRRGEIRIN